MLRLVCVESFISILHLYEKISGVRFCSFHDHFKNHFFPSVTNVLILNFELHFSIKVSWKLRKCKSNMWGQFISNKICLWNRKLCWLSIFFLLWLKYGTVIESPWAESLMKSFTKVNKNCFCVQKLSRWETQQVVRNLAAGLET